MAEELFAQPVKKLADSGIPNSVQPAGGLGLVLDEKGQVPVSLAGGGLVPVGALVDYAGDGDPAPNWLLCDGRSLLRTDYPTLFAVIGTTYGSADATHFTLPDYRGRVAVGPDDMGTAQGTANRLTANDTRGAAAGEEKHLNTSAESGTEAHNHTISPNPHDHVLQESASTGAAAPPAKGGGIVTDNGGGGTGAPIKLTSLTINNAAGSDASTAHNNMQPFQVANKIIRAL